MKHARFALPLFVTTIAVLSLSVDVSNRTLDDWPQWRGKNRDGIATETGLLKTWPAAGPPLAWKTAGAGEGYSSFSAAHGRLYTMGARGGTEYVMAFDAATGKKLWERESGRRFSNDQGDGPRATPVVDGTQLYSLGASGDLTSIDSATGKVAWTVNVLQKFGASNIRWGLSESPLVLQDRILVNPGGRGASIVAVKKTDGSEIWRSGNDAAGYSSAVATTIGGIPMAVFFTDAKAVGVDTRDGRQLWSYARAANQTANIATPIVRGNKVFISSDYGTGAALLELTPGGNTMNAKEVYFTNEMRNHHASSILVRDHLYGFSSAILTAMQFDTGTVAWKNRSVGKGSMVFADERLYLFSERGTVAIAEANPEAYKEHGRFQLTVGSSPTWSHPVVANGKLFLRDQDTIYAYDVRAK